MIKKLPLWFNFNGTRQQNWWLEKLGYNDLIDNAQTNDDKQDILQHGNTNARPSDEKKDLV